MKTQRMLRVLPIIAIAVITACSAGDEEADMKLYLGLGSNNSTAASCLDSMPLEPVSPAEQAALLQLREEELLARDVYDLMYSVYGFRIFDNISTSEQQHTDMVGTLITRYSLPDPAANHVAGTFSDVSIQNLYNALTAGGNASLLDALLVGATIEDLDIHDLETLSMNVVDNQDIAWVFSNLERGSRNHLRSFYSQILRRGGTYTPQYISQAYFTQIVTSSHEQGSNCP